jgi:hypothetical protein
MISSQVYLDTYNQSYRNILVCSCFPEGPLKSRVQRLQNSQISPFENNYQRCILAIMNDYEPMCTDDIPDLFSFLLSNGYVIDTSLTKMMNGSDVKIGAQDSKMVCFVSYKN